MAVVVGCVWHWCMCESNPWQREHNDRDSLHAPKRERKRKEKVFVCVTILTLITLTLTLIQFKSNRTTCSGAHMLRMVSMGTRKKKKRLTHLGWHHSIAHRLGLLVSSCHICTILHHSFTFFPHFSFIYLKRNTTTTFFK